MPTRSARRWPRTACATWSGCTARLSAAPADRTQAGWLAAFAAKEATAKALRWGDEPLPWASIALSADASGRPCIRLSGPAAELARRRGVRRLEVSFTHRHSVAAAVVLAEMD